MCSKIIPDAKRENWKRLCLDLLSLLSDTGRCDGEPDRKRKRETGNDEPAVDQSPAETGVTQLLDADPSTFNQMNDWALNGCWDASHSSILLLDLQVPAPQEIDNLF